jgi:hypothetical protein
MTLNLTPAGRRPFQDRVLWPRIGELIRRGYFGEPANVETMQEMQNAIEVLIRNMVAERELCEVRGFRVEASANENGEISLAFKRSDGSSLDVREFDPDPTERRFLEELGGDLSHRP